MLRIILSIVAAMIISGELIFIQNARVNEPDEYILREVVADYVYAQVIHYVTVNAKYPESMEDLGLNAKTLKLVKKIGIVYEPDYTFKFNLMIPGPDAKGRLWDVRGARIEEP